MLRFLLRIARFLDPAEPGFLRRLRRVVGLGIGAALLVGGAYVAYWSQQPAGRYWSGVVFLEFKLYDLCIRQVKPLVQEGAETYGPYRLLATAYRRSGQAVEMNATYDQAVATFPDDELAHGHRCWYGAIFGQAASVMDSCEKTVRLAAGESGTAFFRRGTARYLLGNRSGAEEDWRAALDVWSERRNANPRYMPAASAWLTTSLAGGNPLDEESVREVQEWF